VLPHLTELELKRLETEDRLRQTTYQLLGGGALVLTFVLTVIQSFVNARQWSLDYEVRTHQERLTHFTESIKAIAIQGDSTAHVAGFYSLRLLASSDPDSYYLLVRDTLATSIRTLATKDAVTAAGLSLECGASLGQAKRQDREEAIPEIQAAMNVLGDPEFAKHRIMQQVGAVALEHLYLDDLNLSYMDFSGAFMSQSRFRRTNLAHAQLIGTDFRGAQFDDWQIPGSAASAGRSGSFLYDEEAEWRRYRCWVADFRHARLEGADFSGAGLAGADFRDAFLKGAVFWGANVSRANFMGAHDLTPEQLGQMCSDDIVIVEADIAKRLKGGQVQPCPR
jgi:uncharacterized protein YjbI with pentapeptide repeats